MRLAVGIVGGGLDEGAVFVYDGDVAAEVVSDVVVRHEVGVEIAAGEADHLQRVGREIAGAAAQDVSVTTVRTYRSAACAPGTHPGGNWCHGSLVGRVQVVAEGVPAQKLSVAALNVVLHRVAIGIPLRVADDGCVNMLCLPFHRCA